MDLLEYQAKELFRQMGIPVLPSQQIAQPTDLKGLIIPYPVVLKSQVTMGGRGRAGGVRMVDNTIDAIAAAQAIFHLPIQGEYPKMLLAEAKYEAEQELYVAVVLDRFLRQPVLLGSCQGGVDVQEAQDSIHHVVVDQTFSPYYARRLALKMGLTGPLIDAVSGVIEKMYRLFLQWDLDLVEINPLAVNAAGEMMALDGKVTANDNAIARHGLLQSWIRDRDRDLLPGMSVIIPDGDGNIGILSNGNGLAMATADLVEQLGGKLAGVLNLGGENDLSPSGLLLTERLDAGLTWLLHSPQVRVVLVNLVSQLISCEEIGQVLIKHVQRREAAVTDQLSNPVSQSLGGEGIPAGGLSPLSVSHNLLRHSGRSPQIVLRLVCDDCDNSEQKLGIPDAQVFHDLEAAARHAVGSLKSTRRGSQKSTK
jgi:succinyl-CoA synthetase beta subunit